MVEHCGNGGGIDGRVECSGVADELARGWVEGIEMGGRELF